MLEHDNDALPLDEEVETSPGVLVRRRSFLALSGALVGAATLASSARAMSSAARAASTPRSGSSLTLEQFVVLADAMAKELVGDTSREGQDRYLLALAALAVRMDEVPVPELREQKKPDGGPSTYIGANDGGEAYTILHWRMEPGSVIGTHPHIYGNVATLVLDGDLRIENFEQVEGRDFDTKNTFLVQRTCEQFLTRGGTNLVNLERNYMHGFRAGSKGARGLDISTRIRERRETPTLLLSKKPVDEARAIYEATWGE